MKNEDFFQKIDTEEKAYWLGMIAADGSIDRRCKSLSIKLSNRKKYNNEHLNHLIKFADIFEASVKFVNEKYIYKCGEDRGENATAVYTHVYSPKLCQDLIKMGIVPNKTYKDISPVFDFIPAKLQSHFIRGVFDGDGCISIQEDLKSFFPKNPDFDIISKCEKFVIIIRDILCKKSNIPLLNIGIGHHGMHKISTKRSEYIIKIRKWMYKNATIYLPRKKEKMDKVKIIKEFPKSLYRGVKFDRTLGRWRSDIPDPNNRRKKIYVGSYTDERDAAKARDAALLQHGIQTCKLNFPNNYRDNYEK